MSQTLRKQLIAVKQSSRKLRSATASQKNQMLKALHTAIRLRRDLILSANRKDLKALPKEATPAFRDRLMLNPKRLDEILASISQVIALADPVGEITEKRVLENRLRVQRVRAPLGTIFMIFESRPNVAIEAFILGFKAGNTMILRGGKESRHTVSAFYKMIERSLNQAGFPKTCFFGLSNPDRKLVDHVLKQKIW